MEQIRLELLYRNQLILLVSVVLNILWLLLLLINIR